MCRLSYTIKERMKNAQFTIISLRNNMFQLADRLVGIYKTNNRTNTKSVTSNPRLYSRNGKEGDKDASAPLKARTNAVPPPA